MTVALAKRQNVMNFHSRASNVLIESNLAVNKIPPQPHKFTSKKSKRQKLICKLYHKQARITYAGAGRWGKVRGKFPGGNFPQREMSNVGNYFIMPNFSSFR